MRTQDIRNALKNRIIAEGLNVTEHMPNVDGNHAVLPRLEVSIQIIDRTGGTLKGNEIKREVGLLSVSVCIEQGVGEDTAFTLADQLSDLFPEGLNLAITDGRITILEPADIRGGYPDDKCWRIPVIIRYEAETT